MVYLLPFGVINIGSLYAFDNDGVVMKNKFLVEAFQTPNRVSKKLRNYFEPLPIDPYIDGNFRFRAYSTYSLKDNWIKRLPHTSFEQPKDVNKLLGGVVRDYQALDLAIDQEAEFQHLLHSFVDRTRINTDKAIIAVHQIRVISSKDHLGTPAPEGVHRDGNEFVGIYCVTRKNIIGGFTQLFSSPGERPHMYTVLEENQFIILDDKRYYHYVSETIANEEGKKGVRDVFVFTA